MWISTAHQPEMQYLRTFETLDILANERESTNGHKSINEHKSTNEHGSYDSPLTNE